MAAAARPPAGAHGPGPPAQRDTLTRLAAGFAVSTSTVWRYLREAIDLLAGYADDLAAAARRAARLAYAIIDGTLIPIDRVADQRPYYSESPSDTA